MANEDQETGEGLLDNETGEIRRVVACKRSQRIYTNVETGEPESKSKNSKERRRVFQVPKDIIKKNEVKCRMKNSNSVRFDEEITSGQVRKLGRSCLEKNIIRGTQNVSPLVFMIPTLFLCPAWASILCVIWEACIHVWAHKRNRLEKGKHAIYKSPLHLITSEFCAQCQSDKRMQRISKLQDERAMRRKLVDTDCIRRVVT